MLRLIIAVLVLALAALQLAPTEGRPDDVRSRLRESLAKISNRNASVFSAKEVSSSGGPLRSGIYYPSIIETWMELIQANVTPKTAIDFAQNYQQQFRLMLPSLLSKSYISAGTNLKLMLGFIKRLPYPTDEIVGLKSMYKLMELKDELTQPQIFMLASRVKEIKNRKSLLAEEDRELVDELVYQLPSVVRNIVFRGTDCKILNYEHESYFYAASDYFNYYPDTRRVFLWTPGGNVTQDSWNFETPDEGETWHIKNAFHGEYLYVFVPRGGDCDWDNIDEACDPADNGLVGEERRKVVTYAAGGADKHKESRGRWRLAAEDGESYVSLLNLKTNEYLFADGTKEYDSERREVFTWVKGKPESTRWEESKWAVWCPS